MSFGTRKITIQHDTLDAALRGGSRLEMVMRYGESVVNELSMLFGVLQTLPKDAELIDVKEPERPVGVYELVYAHPDFPRDEPVIPAPRAPEIPWEYVK